MALSHDFEVKNQPLYHLISGCVERDMGRLKEAQESLETALRLSRTGRTCLSEGRGRGRGELGHSEVATVYLELVNVLTKLGKQVRRREGEREKIITAYLTQHEAAKVMQDAINEFTGTPEEFR